MNVDAMVNVAANRNNAPQSGLPVAATGMDLPYNMNHKIPEAIAFLCGQEIGGWKRCQKWKTEDALH
jgi:hypothetical protein